MSRVGHGLRMRKNEGRDMLYPIECNGKGNQAVMGDKVRLIALNIELHAGANNASPGCDNRDSPIGHLRIMSG